jgi:Leishmanolysin
MKKSVFSLASLLMVLSLAACADSLPVIKNSATEYEINLEFSGEGFSKDRKKVFIQAAQRWMTIIQGDLVDIPLRDGFLPATTDICGFATPEVQIEVIDDLFIFAQIAPIDGPGKVLGQAGPTGLRTTGELPLIGCMQFDEADVEALEKAGTFPQVILHEMGHVLGYGSLWEPIRFTDGSFFNSRDLLDTPCSTNSTTPLGFDGVNAVLEYGVLGQTGNPPVENDFSSGTRCSHWDEDTFDNELMTGFLGGKTSETVNPISAMTIASMKDLGYTVNPGKAESYTIPACSPNCDNAALKASHADEPWEIILQPKGTIDKTGTFSLFEKR